MNRYPILATLLLVALAIGACSDSRYGSLYCPPGPRDTLTVYPRADFQQVEVLRDTFQSWHVDSGMAGMESVYLGDDGETRSSILVNFYFEYEHFFFLNDPDTIASAHLSLRRLLPYSEAGADTSVTAPPGLKFVVRQLSSPLNPRDYLQPPGPEPVADESILNLDFDELNTQDQARLPLEPTSIPEWASVNKTTGLVISTAMGSDPVLVGFASRELTHFQELPPLQVGDPIGPTIIIQIKGRGDPILIPPVFDTSTFERIGTVPPGIPLVPSGIQSIPVLAFDLPELPDGTCLTEVELRLSPMTLSPLWAERDQDLAVSTLDSTKSDWSSGLIVDWALHPDYQFSLITDQPFLVGSIPVSAWNGAFIPLPEVLHLMCSYPDRERDRNRIESGEMYFTQSTFHGPTAAEDLRPKLMLIYGKTGE